MIDLLRLHRHIKWHTPNPQRTTASLALANACVLAGMDKDPSRRGLKQAFEECRSVGLVDVCGQAMLSWRQPGERGDGSIQPRYCGQIARRIQERLQELEAFHVDKHAKLYRAELQMRRCGIILASMALGQGSGSTSEVEVYDWSDERDVRKHEEEHNRAEMAKITRLEMLMR